MRSWPDHCPDVTLLFSGVAVTCSCPVFLGRAMQGGAGTGSALSAGACAPERGLHRQAAALVVLGLEGHPAANLPPEGDLERVFCHNDREIPKTPRADLTPSDRSLNLPDVVVILVMVAGSVRL